MYSDSNYIVIYFFIFYQYLDINFSKSSWNETNFKRTTETKKKKKNPKVVKTLPPIRKLHKSLLSRPKKIKINTIKQNNSKEEEAQSKTVTSNQTKEDCELFVNYSDDIKADEEKIRNLFSKSSYLCSLFTFDASKSIHTRYELVLLFREFRWDLVCFRAWRTKPIIKVFKVQRTEQFKNWITILTVLDYYSQEEFPTNLLKFFWEL